MEPGVILATQNFRKSLLYLYREGGEKKKSDTLKIVVVIGKKMRFLTDILIFFYCIYFEFTGPGHEQRIHQSSGL